VTERIGHYLHDLTAGRNALQSPNIEFFLHTAEVLLPEKQGVSSFLLPGICKTRHRIRLIKG
jgi:hypothetical protein